MHLPFEFEKHFSRICDKIYEFSAYKDGWRGEYGGIAPLHETTGLALDFLSKCFYNGLLPDSVGIFDGGGYVFYWISGDDYATVCINNDGAVAAGWDGLDGTFHAEDIRLKIAEKDYQWAFETAYVIYKNFLKPRGWEGCYAADFVCGEKE